MEQREAISRVCKTFLELSEYIKRLSSSAELLELYGDGSKCGALEDVIKMLHRTGPIIENEMHTSLKEKYLQQTLEMEQIKHNNFMTDIEEHVAEEKILLEKIKAIQDTEIADKNKVSSCTTEDIIQKILKAKEELNSEMDLIEAQYYTQRKINIAQEKDLYIAKRKKEEEYLAILKKYDEDVGSLYRTMKSLTEESSSLDVKLQELEEKMGVQEKIYEELKTERETELMKAFTRDLDNFKRNRSARIIQRTWKKYLEKLALRRKKKSKRKK